VPPLGSIEALGVVEPVGLGLVPCPVRLARRSFGLQRRRSARPSSSDARRYPGASARDPARFPLAEALALYAEEHAPETAAPERIAYATDALLGLWAENAVADIPKQTCRAYSQARGKSDGTIRRELTVLRAAPNYAVGDGRLTYAGTSTRTTSPKRGKRSSDGTECPQNGGRKASRAGGVRPGVHQRTAENPGCDMRMISPAAEVTGSNPVRPTIAGVSDPETWVTERT